LTFDLTSSLSLGGPRLVIPLACIAASYQSHSVLSNDGCLKPSVIMLGSPQNVSSNVLSPLHLIGDETLWYHFRAYILLQKISSKSIVKLILNSSAIFPRLDP
jgi:hypothetical protein